MKKKTFSRLLPFEFGQPVEVFWFELSLQVGHRQELVGRPAGSEGAAWCSPLLLLLHPLVEVGDTRHQPLPGGLDGEEPGQLANP